MFPKISFISLTLFLVLLPTSICRTNESVMPPLCPIESLIIDGSLLPKAMLWYQEVPSKKGAPVRWGIDKLGVGFSSQKNGGALHQIYRGETFSHTEAGYLDLADSWFDAEEDATDWYIPPEFNYQSTVADHYRFGCRTYQPSGVENCQLVGQYGVYLTRFHTFMSPIMTYDDLERILQAIDDKMASCLGR